MTADSMIGVRFRYTSRVMPKIMTSMIDGAVYEVTKYNAVLDSYVARPVGRRYGHPFGWFKPEEIIECQLYWVGREMGDG